VTYSVAPSALITAGRVAEAVMFGTTMRLGVVRTGSVTVSAGHDLNAAAADPVLVKAIRWPSADDDRYLTLAG